MALDPDLTLTSTLSTMLKAIIILVHMIAREPRLTALEPDPKLCQPVKHAFRSSSMQPQVLPYMPSMQPQVLLLSSSLSYPNCIALSHVDRTLTNHTGKNAAQLAHITNFPIVKAVGLDRDTPGTE